MEQFLNIDNAVQRDGMSMHGVGSQQTGDIMQQWGGGMRQNTFGQQDSGILFREGESTVTPQEANELQQRMINMQQYIVDNQARTMQERLLAILGRYVVCEFLVGTQVMYTRSGIMSQVGRDYFILYDPYERNFVGCDAYALKFITIFPEGQRPDPMTEEEQQAYMRKLKQDQRNRIVYAPGVEMQPVNGAEDRVPVLLLSDDQSYMG